MPAQNSQNQIPFANQFIELSKIIHLKIHNKTDGFTNEDKLAGMVKLSEEVGELADQVLGNLGMQRNDKENSTEKLEAEMADVIMSLIMLSHTHGVDINKALLKKLEQIKTRFNLTE